MADLAWIGPHLPDFHLAAVVAFQELGRGAIVIDTGFRVQGGGHPAAYFTQEQVARYEDPNFDRLITEYIPEEELVVILLKESQRTSAYRLRAQIPEPRVKTNTHQNALQRMLYSIHYGGKGAAP